MKRGEKVKSYCECVYGSRWALEVVVPGGNLSTRARRRTNTRKRRGKKGERKIYAERSSVTGEKLKERFR